VNYYITKCGLCAELLNHNLTMRFAKRTEEWLCYTNNNYISGLITKRQSIIIAKEHYIRSVTSDSLGPIVISRLKLGLMR